MIRPARDIYNEMLGQFVCTMKEASVDDNKISTDKYMTLC